MRDETLTPPIIREPFSALSHLFGFLLSIVGVTILVDRAGDSDRALVTVLLYGVSLALLFLCSALLHGLHCSPRVLRILERLDHAAIFLLIAGTYSPVSLLIIRGPAGWFLFCFEWCLALVGIVSLFLAPEISRRAQTLVYAVMGWIFLAAIDPLSSALSTNLLILLFAGGIIYTIGAAIFVSEKPVLWRGVFGAHELWHTLVLAASICHFLLINNFLESIGPA